MNVTELIHELEKAKVPKRWYSINGDLCSDTYILRQVYDQWECYYFDEKGNVNDYHLFNNENDACIYFYNELKDEMFY